MKLKAPFVCLFFVAIFLVSFSSFAQSSSQQDTLNQYIADLQKNPNDNALREKIIKLTLGMTQKPAIPPEVVRHEGGAEYAFKNAKTEADYAGAGKEYEKALLVAPWLAQDYFNCGVAYEKAGKAKEAITAFNFYLMAAPDAKDASDVQRRIGGLEYAAEKTAKESSPEAVAAQEQKKYEDWLKKLDGVKFLRDFGTAKYFFVIRGNNITEYYSYDPSSKIFCESAIIQGREFHMDIAGGFKGTINEDGSSMVLHSTNGKETVYPREER